MYRQRQETTWPFLCVLGCLFILCLAAPRAWQRVAQHRSAAEILGQRLSTVDPVALHHATADVAPEPAADHLASAPAVEPTPIAPTAMVAVEEPQTAQPEPKIAAKYPEGPGSAVATDEGREPAHATPAPSPKTPPTASDELRVATRTPSTASKVDRIPATAVPSKPAVAPSAPDESQDAGLSCWRVPESLQSRFEKLASERRTGVWAKEAVRLMQGIGPALATETAEALRLFEQLDELVGKLEPTAVGIHDPTLATYFRRTGHMLHRRLIVWRYAIASAGPDLTSNAPPRSDARQLALCLANLELSKDERPEARSWEKYLLVDALREACQSRDRQEARLHELAQAALLRLVASPLTAEQRGVLGTPSMVALEAELRHWATESVDLARLLDTVERYEQSGLPSYGGQVAQAFRKLSLSSNPIERNMAERLEMEWRNSNLRLAISQDLLNRLMPARAPEDEPVRDTILGLPVQGRSTTSSDLAVRLIPDRQRLLMAFEVRGHVSASTSSHVGPALFFNDSHASYAAAKPLEIEAEGIRLGQTEVNVINNTRLRALRTRFDAIPLFNFLVREVARNQHEQQRPAASLEAERKLADRARERIDAEAYAQVSDAVAKMRQRLFAPLAGLSLLPTMIAGQTTEERLTMRLRLASEEQMGSHTPRPRAPSDSLASMQIHESAVNNVLEKLDLNGRRMTLPDLAKHVTQKLHRQDAWVVDPNHDDVIIAFAPKDAVCVRCADGLLTLTLSIAELSKEPRSWHHFQIRVCYRAEVCGRQVELVREGVVQFMGRLSPSAQIPIRGVFSRIFAPDQAYVITPEWLTSEPRLEGLAVTQFVIDDGWIGTAIGPDRGAPAAKPDGGRESDSTKNDARRKPDRTATLRQLIGRDREVRR